MSPTSLITDKESFVVNATDFFNTLFESSLQGECGEIEIRIFPKGGYARSLFFGSGSQAAERAYELCNEGENIYFGVNPRVGKIGKKENVKFLCSFHAEVDYGKEGHNKPSKHQTYEECLKAIQEFQIKPTVIVHSGGGFHCYWVLDNPAKVEDYGVQVLENINKALTLRLDGDSGTQDISRVLRVPGTYNLKNPDNPRAVQVVCNSGKRYSIEDFMGLGLTGNSFSAERVKKSPQVQPNSISEQKIPLSIENLPVSERIKALILSGNDGTYPSRSEADMAVITALIHRGVTEERIKEIFLTQPIGEKYRSHPSPDAYLNHSIQKAKEMSNLTEDEIIDPLFVSGCIHKADKGYHLNIVRFQEYMVVKYRMKILENAFFQYNAKCYQHCTEEFLNHLCQKELGVHRKLFSKSSLKEFIHYAIGDKLVDSEAARKDEVSYLTMQNGLYKLDESKMILHSPDIFTTNLLPYDYNPDSKCPRFIQYLEEVFMADKEMIGFVQEAVGYAFHKSIPMPAIFFLIGSGSNGKSVFINTLTNLIGEENTCSISLNSLSNEYYLLNLFGKMINISSETPHNKHINTDIIKAVVAGDWVTGRSPYKQPMKFRPYAKHYLAMNETPPIKDTSHGMLRRIYIIEFPRTFSEKEMDLELTDKLSRELSGIFNWAMDGYNRLRKNSFRFQESGLMKASKQKFKAETNSAFAFINGVLMKSDNLDERVRLSHVYDLYLKFCSSEGYPQPETKEMLRRSLKSSGFKVDRSTKDGNQVYVFGLRLNSLLDPSQ
jgi:P4 family phage/plasmid primase-like protien